MPDDLTRESLATVPDALISAMRPGRELTDLIAMCGTPCVIVSDNGTEITLNAVPECCGAAKTIGIIRARESHSRTHLSKFLPADRLPTAS